MTSSRSKIKGTGGEREIKLILERLTGRRFRKTGAGAPWDLETVDNDYRQGPIRILATRPDRGEWLLSMHAGDWARDLKTQEIRVEVNRWAKFWHHSEYEETFK